MKPPGLRRRGFLALALAGLVGRAARAKAASGEEVIAPIQSLYNRLLDAMKAGKETPFQRRFEIIAPGIDQALDLPAILQTSVGPRWASLAPDQQAELLGAFRQFTIASYAARFDHYIGQRLEVRPEPRSLSADQEVVRTQIVPPAGQPHVLDYVMRQTGESWKAVDVLADGSISQVAVQRSDFRRVLADGGAPALLVELRQKTADLAGGAG